MRIIVAALVLVNALPSAAFGRAKVSRQDVGRLIDWLEKTGKPREDYNSDNAVLIGLKPGEAKSKARGAPGKANLPFRNIHLFFPNKKTKFIVLKIGVEDAEHVDFSTYKVLANGKVSRGYHMAARLDGAGQPIKPKQTDLDLNAKTRQAVAEEIAFWLARAKHDDKPVDGAP